MTRPRILLVPTLTELEWRVRSDLEAWADVVSYDAPGVGAEPPAEQLHTIATAERGLTELDRVGWDRCAVVGDEFGSLAATILAGRRPQAVAALALGHATPSFGRGGERPALNPGVADALTQLVDVDMRTFVRQQLRGWHNERDATAASPESDREAEEYLSRVSHQRLVSFYRELIGREDEIGRATRAARAAVTAPLLLVHHENCLLFTAEGFHAAVEENPGAATAATVEKPSVDPAFSEILREFVERAGG